MTSVLVGQSYYLRFDDKLWRAMQPYPPLGSLYAAAVLREAGHDIAFFDAMLAADEQAWDDTLARYRPEVAVIFEDNFNYLSKMCLLRMRTAAFTMLAMAKARGCVTVVCGSDATDHTQEYIDAGADHIVLGEGEATLRELVQVLATGGALASVVGLTSAGPDRGLVITGRRANLKELDTLPMPAWDLLDVTPYRSAWARHGRFSLNMVTTHGCPFHCNWCAKPIWGQRYNSHSPQRVADELALLRQRFAPDHISFADDIFGLKPGWTRVFADEVRARGIVTPFKCLSRADLLIRDGEVEAFRDAGCETVWMGAESGSQQILDAMDKGTTVEQILEATRRLRAVGIRVAYFLQFGYPGEGPAEIEATRQLVRDGRPDDIGISVSYPLPGTAFYERVRSQLGDRHNWHDSEDLSMLYEGPYPTAFYRQLHEVVHTEFRLRTAAGRTSIGRHAVRALRVPPSRDRLARLRDAVALPRQQRALRKWKPRDAASPPELEVIADAFSQTAERYDSFAGDHPHLTRMREKVYACVRRSVPHGARILELNAGTGTDAVALAQAGYHVHATDVAPGMLARIAPKAAAAGVGDRVSAQACSFLELDQVEGAPYAAVFSDLGGLNCTDDLEAVARGITGAVAPGAIAVLVVMPRICLWELAEVFTGKFGLAVRRLRKGGTTAHLEGRTFTVHYFTPRRVERAFAVAGRWDRVSLEGLSVFTPTAESKNLAKRHPRVYGALAWIDDRLSPHRPFATWGDFFVLVLRRTEDQ